MAAAATFEDPWDMTTPMPDLFSDPHNDFPEYLTEALVRGDACESREQAAKEVDTLIRQGGFADEMKRTRGCQIFDEVRREAGILSLGGTADNEYLWERYADEDRGFCLGFNSEVLGHVAHPVIYVNSISGRALNYYRSSRASIREAACLTKGDKFKLEDELRIIVARGAGTKLSFKPEALVSVTFGRRMLRRDRRKIQRILSRRYPHARLSTRRF